MNQRQRALSLALTSKFLGAASFAGLRALADLNPDERGRRHRLHGGGNRQVNACLHCIAVTHGPCRPRAHAFLERKMREGKTKREARRALKRHLCDVLDRRLHAWAEQALLSPI